jgi:DNA-binding NarL/FixJ family response regulator
MELAVARMRILLAEMPRLLRDIIRREVAIHGDMEIIGTLAARESINEALLCTGADVVIVGPPRSDDRSSYTDILFQQPRLRLVALFADAREAVLYALSPEPRPIGNVSAEELVSALRSAPGTEAS